MSKEQTPIDFEAYLEKMGYSWNDFDYPSQIEGFAEQYAQAKVLEALERERGEQTKLFNNWVKETFNWVDSDVKRYCRMAWFASAKANGIKQK